MVVCKNCGRQFEGKFCNECGQRADTRRLDWQFIVNNIAHDILHFDHGILFTIREILLRPGYTLKNFFEGKRVKYTKPIIYLVLISITYYLFTHIFSTNETPYYTSSSDKTISEFITHYYDKVILTIIIPLAAVFTNLFFPGGRYNFVELFTFHCYMRGQFLLFEMVVMFADWLLVQLNIFLHPATIITLTLTANIVFMTWALKQLYDEKKFFLCFVKAIGLMALIVICAITLTVAATSILNMRQG